MLVLTSGRWTGIERWVAWGGIRITGYGDRCQLDAPLPRMAVGALLFTVAACGVRPQPVGRRTTYIHHAGVRLRRC